MIRFGQYTAVVLSVVFSSMAMAADGEDAKSLADFIDEASEEQSIPIIQNRKHVLTHELALMGGFLPSDPYAKGYGATASYTWHLNDWFAWEIAQFTYSFGVDSKLKRQVLNIALNSGTDAPSFPEIRWIASSRAVLKPFYGKLALFNTSVIHLEAFVSAGFNVMQVDGVEGNQGNVSSRFGTGVDLALGTRLWLTKSLSWRLELGEMLYVVLRPGATAAGLRQSLMVRTGIAVTFGEDW